LSLNLGASISWNPQGLSRPVMGLLYLIKLLKYILKYYLIVENIIINFKSFNYKNLCKLVRHRINLLAWEFGI
jgi:hypothetical protein